MLQTLSKALLLATPIFASANTTSTAIDNVGYQTEASYILTRPQSLGTMLDSRKTVYLNTFNLSEGGALMFSGFLSEGGSLTTSTRIGNANWYGYIAGGNININSSPSSNSLPSSTGGNLTIANSNGIANRGVLLINTTSTTANSPPTYIDANTINLNANNINAVPETNRFSMFVLGLLIIGVLRFRLALK